MATLAESFLADLDDLSDGSGDDDRGRDDEGDAEELPDAAPSVAPGATLASTASLEPSPRYASIMQRVRDALTAGDAAAAAPVNGAEGPAPPPGAVPPPMPPPPPSSVTGTVDADPAYRLLVDCNALAVDIEDEIASLAALARTLYRPKFPELESLVHHPVDYARVVRALGNADDPSTVPLDGLLPQATLMVVAVTAATTAGRPLAEGALAEVMATCDMILRVRVKSVGGVGGGGEGGDTRSKPTTHPQQKNTHTPTPNPFSWTPTKPPSSPSSPTAWPPPPPTSLPWSALTWPPP